MGPEPRVNGGREGQISGRRILGEGGTIVDDERELEGWNNGYCPHFYKSDMYTWDSGSESQIEEEAADESSQANEPVEEDLMTWDD